MRNILFILSFLSFTASGQIKIGDIEVSNEVAKEYFLDCRLNPDTVWLGNVWDEKENTYRDFITSHALYEVKDPVSEKNIRDFELAHPTKIGHTHNGGLYYATECYAGEYMRGYAIPRNPTAEDFAKWYLNHFTTSK